MNHEELNKIRDEEANKQGSQHAHPILRSMYPLTSRGEMASQFAQLFTLGFNYAVEVLKKEKENGRD